MNKRNKGFTVFEIAVAVAIGVFIGMTAVATFSGLSNSKSLDRDAVNVLSYIEKARGKAIDSVGGVEHGVKFASSYVKVFSGTSYITTNTEATYAVPVASLISSISLSNATTTLYFSKLTGNASATGTITISRGAGGSKTIKIYATGLAEIQ